MISGYSFFQGGYPAAAPAAAPVYASTDQWATYYTGYPPPAATRNGNLSVVQVKKWVNEVT